MILMKELKELLKEMWTNLSDGDMCFHHSVQEEKQLHNTGLTKSLTVQVKGANFRFQNKGWHWDFLIDTGNFIRPIL